MEYCHPTTVIDNWLSDIWPNKKLISNTLLKKDLGMDSLDLFDMVNHLEGCLDIEMDENIVYLDDMTIGDLEFRIFNKVMSNIRRKLQGKNPEFTNFEWGALKAFV